MRNLWLLFLVGLATGLVSEKLLVCSQPTVAMDDLYLELEGRTSGDLPLDDEDGEDGEDDGSGSGSGDYIFRDFTEYYVRTTQSSESVPSKPKPTANSPHVPATTAADSQHPTTVMDGRMAPDTVTDGAGKKDEEHANIGSTADWFTHRTTMTHSTPPSETTRVSVDDNVDKDREEDNSVDEKDVPTSTTIEDVHPTNENNNEIVPIDGRGSRFYNMGKPEEVTSENLWERTEVLAAVIACGVVGFLCAVFLLLLLAYRMKKKDEGSYDLGDTKLSNTQYHKAPTKEFYA